MASPAKKVRKANFSPAGISVLTEKFEENIDILQSKFTNNVTNAKKEKNKQTTTRFGKKSRRR